VVLLLQLQLWRSCLIVLLLRLLQLHLRRSRLIMLLLWLLPLLVHLLLWLLPVWLSLLRHLVLLLLVVGLRGMLHSLILLLWLLISRLIGLMHDSLLLVCWLLWLLLLHDNHLCRLLHIAVPIGCLPGCLHLLLLRCKLMALHVESRLHLLHLLLLRHAKASRRSCCCRLHCCHSTCIQWLRLVGRLCSTTLPCGLLLLLLLRGLHLIRPAVTPLHGPRLLLLRRRRQERLWQSCSSMRLCVSLS